ncbi:hypothetical protein BH11PSE5_BH11PSE5_27070 [soil metagenome]
MSLMICAIASGAISCTGPDAKKASVQVTVKGVRYSFPYDHVLVTQLSEQRFHVVICPLGHARERRTRDTISLTLSDKNYRELATPTSLPAGIDLANVPVVSSISSGPAGKFDVVKSDVGPVVCYPGPYNTNCGFSIHDANLKWSVQFDRSRLGEVATIKAGAEDALVGYRRSATIMR